MNINLWDKIKIGFAAMFGGVAGLVKALLNWFNNKVLSRIKDKETATKYVQDIRDVRFYLCAIFARHTEWMSDERRKAADMTLAAIDALCAALEDWQVTPEELDKLVDAVKAAVDAWKVAKKKRLQIVTVSVWLLLGSVLAMAAALTGCKTYYENVGVRVRAGEITAPIEVSEPTSSTNARFLFFLNGVDLYAAKGSTVEMTYNSVSSGSWLTSATTQSVAVVVSPVCSQTNNLSGDAEAGNR